MEGNMEEKYLRRKSSASLSSSLASAVITPVGKAIGIGVLNQFNGNHKATSIAIGTLDTLSAGIMVWVIVVETWAGDYMHGDLATWGVMRTVVELTSLVAGLVLSVLGKFA
jgi:zinc transporter 1/2/3